MKVAFLGLGVMGFPMAGRLAQVGHDVAIYNRTAEKAEAWLAQHRGRRALSPSEAAKGAEIVFACVTRDSDTREVAEAAFSGMSPGAIFVDHGSGSPEAARILAVRAAEKGVQFLDAPVTGARVGAENGTLSILVGGDEAALARAAPAMQAYARTITWMGPSGAGHLTKLVNVIIGHGNGAALAEGLAFAIRAGLEPRRVIDALIGGSSRSWHMEHRADKFIDRDGVTLYSVDFARKDLGAALAEARLMGAELPVSALVAGMFERLAAQGAGGRDVGALIELMLRE